MPTWGIDGKGGERSTTGVELEMFPLPIPPGCRDNNSSCRSSVTNGGVINGGGWEERCSSISREICSFPEVYLATASSSGLRVSWLQGGGRSPKFPISCCVPHAMVQRVGIP